MQHSERNSFCIRVVQEMLKLRRIIPTTVKDLKENGIISLETGPDGEVVSLIKEQPSVDLASFYEKGYLVLRNAFPPSVVDEIAATIKTYVKNEGKLAHPFQSGYTIADFASDPDLSTVFEAVHNHKRIHGVLSEIFGGRTLGKHATQYRFLGHNNINVGGNPGWHKDRLNGVYRHYERYSPWATINGTTMQILKVAAYFQDHSSKDDLTSLRVLPGSHMVPDIPKEKYNVTCLHPAKGDVIIFDQRLTHRGQGPIGKTDYPAPNEIIENGQAPITEITETEERIMLQIGYGVNNNVHSDDFELGTWMRQKQTNNPECGYSSSSSCSADQVLLDLRKRTLPRTLGWRLAGTARSLCM